MDAPLEGLLQSQGHNIRDCPLSIHAGSGGVNAQCNLLIFLDRNFPKLIWILNRKMLPCFISGINWYVCMTGLNCKVL